jgi:hypothetical protein
MRQEACPTCWNVYGRSVLQVYQVVVLKHRLGVEHLLAISEPSMPAGVQRFGFTTCLLVATLDCTS